MRIIKATPKTAIEHDGRVTSTVAAPTAARRFLGDDDRSVSGLRATDDAGYALAMTAMLLVPLMVFLAFAIDLGAWYGQASKVQRATDAAAMAGVVWLPNQTTADTAAIAVLNANGFPGTFASPPTGFVSAIAPCQCQYSVSLSSPTKRFFSQVFGTPQFSLTRSATAQFNKPIPMGSPSNTFGSNMPNTPAPPLPTAPPAGTCPQNQPISGASSPCGNQPLLWSAINGPYDNRDNGDPYSTKCKSGGGSGTGCTQLNPTYRNTGFNFAVDIGALDVGTPITVKMYDIGDYPRSITNSTGAIDGTKDCSQGAAPFSTNSGGVTYTSGGNWVSGYGAGNCQTGDDSDAQNMALDMYQNDGSDLVVSYGALLGGGCSWSMTAANLTTNAATYKNTWATLCTFTPTMQGIYPLRVRNSGIAGMTDAGKGTNAYALKITGGTYVGSTPQSKVYALDDMSIFTNAPGSTSKFYLAEIKPEHAGKKLQIDLYDPGDGNGASNFTLQIKAPSAGAPAATPTGGTTIPLAGVANSCSYNSTPAANKGPATPNAAANCTVTTHTSGNNIYNGNWLRFEIVLSTTYTCGTVAIPDCWWTVNYNFGVSGFPTDRTVWSINVVGDPVHLVK